MLQLLPPMVICGNLHSTDYQLLHTCVPPVYSVAYTAVLFDDLAEKYSVIVGSLLLANNGHEGMPR
jgi:hypothetical protein